VAVVAATVAVVAATVAAVAALESSLQPALASAFRRRRNGDETPLCIGFFNDLQIAGACRVDVTANDEADDDAGECPSSLNGASKVVRGESTPRFRLRLNCISKDEARRGLVVESAGPDSEEAVCVVDAVVSRARSLECGA
jgi:hypothetical protein